MGLGVVVRPAGPSPECKFVHCDGLEPVQAGITVLAKLGRLYGERACKVAADVWLAREAGLQSGVRNEALLEPGVAKAAVRNDWLRELTADKPRRWKVG